MSTHISLIKRNIAYLKAHYFKIREWANPSKIQDAFDIPIIINNFNRLTTLKKLVSSIEKRGYKNIYILDNNSSFPPLLDYYRSCPYEVIMLKENLGFKALWKNKEVRKRFCNDYYVYTDSDVVLCEDCPHDIITHLHRLLKNKYKYSAKIGLSLCIDDLPDCYSLKQKVIEWESKYYKNKNEDNLYRAPVDTTFALYRPKVGLSRSRSIETYRTAHPYQLKHLPWYTDSQNISAEELYYITHCKQVTSWSSLSKNKKEIKA